MPPYYHDPHYCRTLSTQAFIIITPDWALCPTCPLTILWGNVSSIRAWYPLIGPNLRSLSLGPQSGFDANAPSSDPRTEHVDVEQEISPHIHSHTSSFHFLLIIVCLLLSPPTSYICSKKFHSIFVCLQVICLWCMYPPSWIFVLRLRQLCHCNCTNMSQI